MDATSEITLPMCELAHMSTPVPDPRWFTFRGQEYILRAIGPADPRRIAEAEGVTECAKDFPAQGWVVGLAVAKTEAPDDDLGFYAVAHGAAPERLDDTLAFVAPRARGLHLSHLLIYGVYLELLALDRPFVLCEMIDHPRLRLHARCGFAPPVRPLRDGKVELGRFDLHAVLCRIESEDDIREILPSR
ncbi:MAG: hypothetical protein HZB55_18355 [Deltaproteobacteria bacterium]|nr:hypothetical protein [Deltaproteobacteria bacterium]